MTRATILWYLKGLPQSINLPPEHMPEVSKEAEVTGWPLTRVEFRPLPAPSRLCSPLLFSVDSPALLPGGTPAALPLHYPAVSSFIHSPPPYTLPYFIFCLPPLEVKVHAGKDFFFSNLLLHPHHLEQSRAPSMHSDHVCLMNEFFVENEILKISHFPEREK